MEFKRRLGLKNRRGRKLQFSDRGDYGCSKCQICPYISSKLGVSGPKFRVLDENFHFPTFFGISPVPGRRYRTPLELIPSSFLQFDFLWTQNGRKKRRGLRLSSQ